MVVGRIGQYQIEFPARDLQIIVGRHYVGAGLFPDVRRDCAVFLQLSGTRKHFEYPLAIERIVIIQIVYEPAGVPLPLTMGGGWPGGEWSDVELAEEIPQRPVDYFCIVIFQLLLLMFSGGSSSAVIC